MSCDSQKLLENAGWNSNRGGFADWTTNYSLFHLFCGTPFPPISQRISHIKTSFSHPSPWIKKSFHVLICVAKKVELTVVLPGHSIDRRCSTDVNMVARHALDVPSVLRHVISITRQPAQRHNDDNQSSVTWTVEHVPGQHDNVSSWRVVVGDGFLREHFQWQML